MQGPMPVIPQDAIIDIQVNGSFYYRVTQLLMSLLDNQEPERVKEIFERINNNNVQEILEANVETIAVLMNEIERCAKDQGKIQEVNVNDLEDSEEEA